MTIDEQHLQRPVLTIEAMKIIESDRWPACTDCRDSRLSGAAFGAVLFGSFFRRILEFPAVAWGGFDFGRGGVRSIISSIARSGLSVNTRHMKLPGNHPFTGT